MILSTHSVKEVSAALKGLGIAHRCHYKALFINITDELSSPTQEAIRRMRDAIEWASVSVQADRSFSDDPSPASHSR